MAIIGKEVADSVVLMKGGFKVDIGYTLPLGVASVVPSSDSQNFSSEPSLH